MALKRPADTSHARGLSGHPDPRPLFDGGGERVVHRLLGKVEVPEQPNQRGEHPARIGLVDGIHHLADPVVVNWLIGKSSFGTLEIDNTGSEPTAGSWTGTCMRRT